MQTHRSLTAVFATAIAAAFVSVPLAVSAQTANTPGGQAATGSGLDQTTKNPQETTPGRTRTSPDMTNPKGKLPVKHSNGVLDQATDSNPLRPTSKLRDVPAYPNGTPNPAVPQ
jgi:hypothetical protein